MAQEGLTAPRRIPDRLDLQVVHAGPVEVDEHGLPAERLRDGPGDGVEEVGEVLLRAGHEGGDLEQPDVEAGERREVGSRLVASGTRTTT